MTDEKIKLRPFTVFLIFAAPLSVILFAHQIYTHHYDAAKTFSTTVDYVLSWMILITICMVKRDSEK